MLRLRTDDQLVSLFRSGNDAAFDVIHDRYRQRLFAYARQMLGGSRSDAEDVLQDVFLRAYRTLRADRRPVMLRAWLYRVAHNRCIDHLRRPTPPAAELFELSRAPLHDPIEQAQRSEDLRRLVADVQRLPAQQRSALLMREMEGLSYEQLASALDVSLPAVKSLLVRARVGLVEAIEARDADCDEIRADIAAAIDRGVRCTGRVRRHTRECDACSEYATRLRGVSRALNSLSPGGHGPFGMIAKLLGLGGAGAGSAAGTTVGGGAAVSSGVVAATATKVAVVVCCAALATSGAAELSSSSSGKSTQKHAKATTPVTHVAHVHAAPAAPGVIPSPASVGAAIAAVGPVVLSRHVSGTVTHHHHHHHHAVARSVATAPMASTTTGTGTTSDAAPAYTGGVVAPDVDDDAASTVATGDDTADDTSPDDSTAGDPTSDSTSDTSSTSTTDGSSTSSPTTSGTSSTSSSSSSSATSGTSATGSSVPASDAGSTPPPAVVVTP